MEWLRSRPFLNKQPRAMLSTDEDCDPEACFDSFREHWQQALKIIQRVQQLPTHDDVLGVMNHLEQMVTLLLYDIKKMNKLQVPISDRSRCLNYMLTENILHKLNLWGMKVGKYTNAVRCEQLKIYEMLVSQSRHVLLVHEPFLKPLLSLLQSCQGDLFSKEMEKFLVDLLYQLCALLMQNMELINLFFHNDEKMNKFIIFTLLITFVHREDSVGMRARDALLLCMSLSKLNEDVAKYIAENSNFSILVASGLSGLYSVLPNYLDDIAIPDWHRFTPDDVNDIKGLSTFVTSLEFSNAVAQVAHKSICEQLQDYMYKGFLIPVLGPALLQQNIDEQVASMAYLELVLRTVTEPGLLYSLLQFLLKTEYDEIRLLDILIQRLDSDNNQLSLVTLTLFETMIDLNCEDLMLELVLQYLQPCLHLMLSQRKKLAILDPYCNDFENLLMLSPLCCDVETNSTNFDETENWNYAQQSLCGRYDSYLYDARNRIESCQNACTNWSNSYNGEMSKSDDVKCTGNSANSLPSSLDSLGYESLNNTKLHEEINSEPPPWKMSSNKNVIPETDNSVNIEEKKITNLGNAGPFLNLVLKKLNNYLSNSFYINLHLTGLISRLAVFPQALLRTYLIDHTLVLQPNVPSLIQIIGSLKQKIDEYLMRKTDRINLIKNARKFLIERETRLINTRRHVIEQCNPEMNEFFQRNGPKRRSLNLSSLSGMFGKKSVESPMPLVATVENPYERMYPKFNESQHVALCAVLLDEWVKELAAIAQEHTIAQLAKLLK